MASKAGEMLVGCELDAEIARRVFGWMDVRPEPICVGGPLDWFGRNDGVRLYVPCYSNNIFVAWTVVEHLRGKGWLVSVLSIPHRLAPESAEREMCDLIRPDPILNVRVYAPTAAEAICRAALQALREEDPE